MALRLTNLILIVALAGCGANMSHKRTSVDRLNGEAFSENVIFVPVSKFVDASQNHLEEFVPVPVSQKSVESIKSKLSTLPGFPNNSYSGCHARAHFDYMKLNDSARNGIYKIWLLSSSLVSPALSGAITYDSKNGNQASWDYHVAVAYTDDNKNEWVVDRLISDEPMIIGDWIKQFSIDGYSLLTRSNPDNYLFNKTSVPASDPVNFPNGFLAHFVPKNVFNGTFYTYSGMSLEQHWGASDIAADALSSAFQNGKYPSCKWKSFSSQTLKLKNNVEQSDIPAECQGAKKLYTDQFKVWKNRGL